MNLFKVGIACIQLAKTQGLKVIGTAGSDAGLKLVKEQGADYVFNHREKNYMEKIKSSFPDGIELVLEMLANVNLENDLYILKWKKGRVVVCLICWCFLFTVPFIILVHILNWYTFETKRQKVDIFFSNKLYS